MSSAAASDEPGSTGIGVQFERLGHELWRAERTRTVLSPPAESIPGLDLDGAYRIQQANIAHRLAAGERAIGRKVGLTSLAMQRQLGIAQPDFGVITDAMVIGNGGTVLLSELIQPRVEPEFAFRIGSDLSVSPSMEEVREGIDGVAVALEIIDSRIADWKIGLVDTVADNASSARVLCAPFRSARSTLLSTLPNREIRLVRNGARVASGLGSAVLGDPLLAVHWLAGAIGRFGESLRAGEIILAGAVSGAVPLDATAEWTADAMGFEPVRVFSAGLDSR